MAEYQAIIRFTGDSCIVMHLDPSDMTGSLEFFYEGEEPAYLVASYKFAEPVEEEAKAAPVEEKEDPEIVKEVEQVIILEKDEEPEPEEEPEAEPEVKRSRKAAK